MVSNKLITLSTMDNCIFINKKDNNKVYELRMRLVCGINTIGSSYISKLYNNKYLINLQALIKKIKLINPNNTYIQLAIEFATQLEKLFNTKQANRYDLLQYMMDDLE